MPGTVTVALNHPHGVILQHQVKDQEDIPVMGGGFKTVDRWRKTGKTIEIKGWAHAVEKQPKVPLVGFYALTTGVDADFFNEWLKQNADSDLVRNKRIFARANEVEKQAKEMRSERSGLEPLDPKNPLPEFRKIAPKPATDS